jgi:outer membrane protein
MTLRLIGGGLAASLLATTAFAQTTPARPAAAASAAQRPAATPSNPGPAIAGVCVVDGAVAISSSAAGQAATNRLRQLGQQVEAELTAQRGPLTTEANRIQALPEAQRAAPTQAISPRVQAFQRLGQQRQQELALTQQRAIQQIEAQLQTVISQLYVQRGCGLLIDRSAVVYSNPAIDLTPAAITALNARMPTITFDRATLPATQTPAAR